MRLAQKRFTPEPNEYQCTSLVAQHFQHHTDICDLQTYMGVYDFPPYKDACDIQHYIDVFDPYITWLSVNFNITYMSLSFNLIWKFMILNLTWMSATKVATLVKNNGKSKVHEYVPR